jgi:hypothetical protein
MTRARVAVAMLLAACALVTATGSATWSAWTATATSATSTISAAPDGQAPVVGSAVVGKSGGGSTDFIQQGGGYYVYANVTDAGNPASGTSTVTAGAASISTGLTAAVLSAGSFSAQGVSYNRRSAALTADASLAAGSYATTIAATDVAANSAVVSGPSVTVDNVAPSGSSVSIVNGGATTGRPDAGDTIALGWSETIDPYSILGGWSGSQTAVQVIIVDGGAKSDSIVFRSTGGVALALGSITPNNDYVTSSATFAATMIQTGGSIVLTLGALVSGTPRTDTHKAGLSWSTAAVAGATDRAGNALAGSTVNESGLRDYDF